MRCIVFFIENMLQLQLFSELFQTNILINKYSLYLILPYIQINLNSQIRYHRECWQFRLINEYTLIHAFVNCLTNTHFPIPFSYIFLLILIPVRKCPVRWKQEWNARRLNCTLILHLNNRTFSFGHGDIPFSKGKHAHVILNIRQMGIR